MERRSTILIADDTELNRCLLRDLFETDYNVLEATDGQAAIDILRKRRDVSLLLLDLIMPNKDGYSVLQEMNNEDLLDETPVVVVTASRRVSDEVRVLELGASDIILMPFHVDAIRQRVQNVINMQLRFKEVARSKEKYKLKAQRDSLTNLYNKISAQSLIEKRLKEQADNLHAFLILDLDNFKRINDTFGHAVGDYVLQEFSALLKEIFDEPHIIGRMGGDEFVVFVSDILDVKLATTKASQIIARFAQHEVTTRFPMITASVGIAMYPQDGQNYDTLYCSADKALYSAKKSGKNQYVIFGENTPKVRLAHFKNPEALLDAMEDIVYITDVATYEMIYANKATEEMVGYTLTGKNEKCYKILYGLDAPCSFCDVTKLSMNQFYPRIRNFQMENKSATCLVRGKLIDWNGILAHMEVGSELDKLLPKDFEKDS